MDIREANFNTFTLAAQQGLLLTEENGLLMCTADVVAHDKQQKVVNIISSLFFQQLDSSLHTNQQVDLQTDAFLQLVDNIRRIERIFFDRYPAHALAVSALENIRRCVDEIIYASSLQKHSEHTQSHALTWQMMNTLWHLFALVTNSVSDTAMLITDAVKNNLLDDNHPWKQKKYEVAIRLFRNGFERLSNYELKGLIELLEGHIILSQSPLRESLLDIFKKMQLETSDHRRLYYSITGSLRSILESEAFKASFAVAYKAHHEKEPLELAVKLILTLCESRYCEVYLYAFCECLVDRLLKSSNLEAGQQLVDEDFNAITQACYSRMGAVRASVSKGKLQGWININFDPAMQQNIPYVLADIPLASLDGMQVKMVRFIRMGCPTIEGFIYRAAVAPEYVYFLFAQYFQQKTHLYISLQSDIPQLAGDESTRNQACRALQATHTNFFYVVLDQDTDFYQQSAAFSDLSWSAFISIFEERVFGLNMGYDFPLHWKSDPTFVLGVQNIFKMVANMICATGTFATIEQRRNFIEIFQALLVIFCIRFSHADTVNVTCKDAIDRAMKTLSLLLQIVITAQGNADNSIYQKIHRVCTHAPAFLVKKQAMIDSRRKRLMSAFNLINSAEIRAALIKHARALGIIGHSFEVHAKTDQNF